jgi:hypothetical protein
VEGSCEHGIEPSGSIKCWEVLEGLHNWRLLEKGSAPYVSKYDSGRTGNKKIIRAQRHTDDLSPIKDRGYIQTHRYQGDHVSLISLKYWQGDTDGYTESKVIS